MNAEQIKQEQERVKGLLEGIGTWITADTGRPFGGDCAVITAENSPYDGHAEICECGDPEEAAFIAAAPDIARAYLALLDAHLALHAQLVQAEERELDAVQTVLRGLLDGYVAAEVTATSRDYSRAYSDAQIPVIDLLNEYDRRRAALAQAGEG